MGHDAVVLDVQISQFKAGAGNIFAPSSTNIVFAVNMGVGRWTAPLSELDPQGEGRSKSPEVGQLSNPDIDELFGAENLGKPTENRTLITGNILRGFSEAKNKGRIVKFSTADGKRIQGILMPRDFNPENDLRPEKPLKTPEEIL